MDAHSIPSDMDATMHAIGLSQGEYDYREMLYQNWPQPLLLNVSIELIRLEHIRKGLQWASLDDQIRATWMDLCQKLPPVYATVSNFGNS